MAPELVDHPPPWVREPHPRRTLVVSLVCAVVVFGLIPVAVLSGVRPGVGSALAALLLTGLTLLLLRQRDLTALRAARDAYEARHPEARVDMVLLDPLWMPEDPTTERDPTRLTSGLLAIDDARLTVIEEGRVILSVDRQSVVDLRRSRRSITFTVDGNTWSVRLA